MFGRNERTEKKRKENEFLKWLRKLIHLQTASSVTMPQFVFLAVVLFQTIMLSGHTCSIEHVGST